jgi:hypothetical protein
MEKISPPVRIFAILIVLAGAAGMLAMRTMGASPESAPIPLPVKKAVATPVKAATAAKAAVGPSKAAVAKPVVAKPVPAKPPVNPVIRPSGFPAVVDKALREHAVVVLSLVIPGARVYELAAAEAEAGAHLGGAGFLALNVANEGVARSVLAKLKTDQDPSVLVVKRSGEVAVTLGGFVDRETVAQAAASAAS